MGRSPCCDKVGLKKGQWTREEDQKLLAFIQEHGHGSWRALPPKAGLQRNGKSCRLRWTNYLRPDIKRGKFSLQEEQTIIQLHALLGNRWSAIASRLPKRTDNEIKNYWNFHLKKILVKMGIDPTTHKPKSHALGYSQPKYIANLSHMAQWESARLEAEARNIRESKLVANGSLESPTSTLNFSNNTIPAAVPTVGLMQENAFAADHGVNYVSTPGACTIGKGITENSLQLHNDDLANMADSLKFPSFMHGFSDLPPGTIAADHNVSTTIGLMQENAFAADHGVNYVSTPGACTIGKGITENSLQLHDDDLAYMADSLKFPSFMHGFSDLPPGTIAADHNVNVFEDNKINYWSSNILSVVNSPMGSPVF